MLLRNKVTREGQAGGGQSRSQSRDQVPTKGIQNCRSICGQRKRSRQITIQEHDLRLARSGQELRSLQSGNGNFQNVIQNGYNGSRTLLDRGNQDFYPDDSYGPFTLKRKSLSDLESYAGLPHEAQYVRMLSGLNQLRPWRDQQGV
jgi:hypothetical protein